MKLGPQGNCEKKWNGFIKDGGKMPKRIRPWQREGFSSKKEWATMRKRINNLIWKDRREVA